MAVVTRQLTGAPGETHKFIAYRLGQPWNGAAYEDWDSGNWDTYLIDATPLQASSPVFNGEIPDDADRIELRLIAEDDGTDPVVDWVAIPATAAAGGDATLAKQEEIIKRLQLGE